MPELKNAALKPRTKQPPYLTVIEDRSPREKAHTSRGLAHSAIKGRFYSGRVGASMALYVWSEDHWELLHELTKGEPVTTWNARLTS